MSPGVKTIQVSFNSKSGSIKSLDSVYKNPDEGRFNSKSGSIKSDD